MGRSELEPTRRDVLRYLALSPFAPAVASGLVAACRPEAAAAPGQDIQPPSSPRAPEQLSIFPNLEEDWEGNRFTTVKTADGIQKKIILMGKDTKWGEIEKPLGQVFKFLTEEMNPQLIFYNMRFHGKHQEGYSNLFPPGSYNRETTDNKLFTGISARTFNENNRVYNGRETRGTISSGDVFAALSASGEIAFILAEFQGEFARMQRQPQFVLASAPIYGPQIVNLPPDTPQAWEEQDRTYVNDSRKPWRTWYSLSWQNPDGTTGQLSYRHQPGLLKYHANIWKIFGPLPYNDMPLI